MNNHCYPKNAFSLVEMVLSVAIIAILASVSVISFSNVFKSGQLNHTTKRFVADLKLTKQQAIQDQNAYSFNINLSGRHYQAPGVKPLTGIGSILVNLKEAPHKSTAITLNLADTNNHIIVFDASGQVANYGTITLTNGDLEKIITITAEGEIDATL